MTAYPIFVESCDAPITAIDRGVKYSIGTGTRSFFSTFTTESVTMTRASTAHAPDSYAGGVDIEFHDLIVLFKEPGRHF